MDKIFREIKNAIEEEMRNAESGPPPGGGRSQGGRRAQEYAEWLKEEQKRLRGDQQQDVYQPEELEEVPVETRTPQSRRSEQGQRRQRSGDRQKRDRSQGSRRQQHERQSRDRQSEQPAGESSGERAKRLEQQERQRQSQRRRASEPQTASAYRNRIERQLKSPGGLRMAFLMREIVSKPVSLRDKDDHLIS